MESKEATFLRIGQSPWMDETAVREAAELVSTFLAGHPAAKVFTTSGLMRGLGVPIEAMTGFARKLASARAWGMLEGYYEKGKPNHGTFGKPAIIWRGEGAEKIDVAAAEAEIKARLARK